MVVAPVEAVAESGNYGSFQVAAENEQKEDVSNTKEQESYVNNQYEQPKDESVTEGEVVHEQQEQGYTQVEGGKSKRDYQQQQYVPRGSVFVQPTAEEKYEEISNAYEVLSDDEKISLYNRFGEAGVKGAGGMGGMWNFINPFDLFESLFQGMGGMGGGGMGSGSRSRAVDGQDEYYTLILRRFRFKTMNQTDQMHNVKSIFK